MKRTGGLRSLFLFMPRISRQIKELGEKNRSTMEACEDFKEWKGRFLRNKERLSDYEKAFNFIKADDVEETPRLRSSNED